MVGAHLVFFQVFWLTLELIFVWLFQLAFIRPLASLFFVVYDLLLLAEDELTDIRIYQRILYWARVHFSHDAIIWVFLLLRNWKACGLVRNGRTHKAGRRAKSRSWGSFDVHFLWFSPFMVMKNVAFHWNPQFSFFFSQRKLLWIEYSCLPMSTDRLWPFIIMESSFESSNIALIFTQPALKEF